MVEQELSPRDPGIKDVRARIRSGEHAGSISGIAGGYVQTNLTILTQEYAFDFLKFCMRNPKPSSVFL